MKVVFLGINDTGWEIYEWLCDRDGVTVSALLTRKEQLSLIEDIKPDLVVAAGFRHIVPEEILAVPDIGCLNVHPGYLPEGRGFYPNVWSIVEGHPAGATIHFMDAGIDTGDIVDRERVDQNFDDDGKSLYKRIEQTSVDLFKRVWPDIESGNVSATQQSDDEATYHYKSEFEELCQLDASAQYTVKELLNVLRALTFPPHENAVVKVDGDRYHVEVAISSVADSDA